MTIAAALLCTDGVVVCADTNQEVPNFTKVNQGKIRSFVNGKDGYVFTGAGDADLIEFAMDEIVQGIMRRKSKLKLSECRAFLLVRAKNIFSDHIEPYALFPAEERPSMNLLASMQIDGKTRVFKINNTLVTEARDHISIGIGNSVATGLIDRYFRGQFAIAQFTPEITLAGNSARLPMSTTARLGAYLLESVKTYVPGCGGYTEIIEQGFDGTTRAYYASEWMHGFPVLDEAITSILYTVLGEDECDAVLGKMEAYLQGVRKFFRS